MAILIGLLALTIFVQVYWLIPKSYQNHFLIAGSFIFGAFVFPLTFAVALILGGGVFLILARELKISGALVTAVCFLPLMAFKIFPSLFVGVNLLGLSYFTFILLGAFYDIRNKKDEQPLTAIQFFAFILFFPILPVGPIERIGGLGRQIREPRHWKPSNFTIGLLLIAFGIFKKTVIADRLGELALDSEMNSLSYFGTTMWAFSFLALLQVFADFSSIVDIVRGFGKLLGFNIVDNFDRPYLADSIQDIWRRWHISLVSWLRDIVYAPLALRTRSVLLSSTVVILMVGFWHDASWRFGLWSLYWISIFWVAVFLRQRGIRLNIGKLPKRISMVAVMAFSTIFVMPSSAGDLVILAGNFFRFTDVSKMALNVSKQNLTIALLGFGVVVVVDHFGDKLKIKFRPAAGAEPTTRFQVVSILMASALFVFSIALAVGDWEKFIYLRY